MRVLFVNCVDFMEATLPEGIALLSAILKERGHDVEVFDTSFLKPRGYKPARVDKDDPPPLVFHKPTAYNLHDLVAGEPEVDIVERFSCTIDKFKPSLIAVSTMTTNYSQSLNLIKEVRPSCKVIFGGVHPTLMPEEVISEEVVDFVCIGEGDEALPELCESLEKDVDPSGIRNLYVKKDRRSGEIVRNDLRPFMDLDLLPPPDLGVFGPHHLFRPFLGKIYKGIFMSTSRGCPRGCYYCVNSKLRSIFRECGNNYIRFQSPEVVARNVRFLNEEYGVNWIKFSDDTFLMRPLEDIRRLRDLLSPMGIMFGCSVDPATVTEEKVRMVKEAGCVAMSIGVETGNENLRSQVFGRHISDRQIRKAIDIVRGHDIKISTFNIIGLPGETRENIYETIRFNRELGVPDANIYILYPYPGTKIYEDFNISYDKYGDIPPVSDAHVFNLSRLTGGDLKFFLKTFNLHLVLPESQWSRIEESKNDPELYRELVGMARDIVRDRAV